MENIETNITEQVVVETPEVLSEPSDIQKLLSEPSDIQKQKIKELEAQLEALKTHVEPDVVESLPLAEDSVKEDLPVESSIVGEDLPVEMPEIPALPTLKDLLSEPEPDLSVIPKVIQNSDVLYKSSIQWANNTDYVEPNHYEIAMLAGTKKPKELLEEEASEEIVLKSEEEIKKQKTKDLLLIFKVVSLNRLGHHPIQNTSMLQPLQLKQFLDMMNTLIEDYNQGLEVEITSEFNKICNEKLFHNDADISKYPVYA